MLGCKPFQEKLFSQINLRGMIPDSHLLVKIDELLDFSFIYDLTKELYCANKVRPSVDPVLFFRMQIIAYVCGISSDRQLCEDIHLNIAYRWFCRLNLEDKVPDHSSLSKIRDRFGVETFQAIFEKLILQWKESGLIKGERMMSDASIVEANASMDSLIERQDSDPMIISDQKTSFLIFLYMRTIWEREKSVAENLNMIEKTIGIVAQQGITSILMKN